MKTQFSAKNGLKTPFLRLLSPIFDWHALAIVPGTRPRCLGSSWGQDKCLGSQKPGLSRPILALFRRKLEFYLLVYQNICFSACNNWNATTGIASNVSWIILGTRQVLGEPKEQANEGLIWPYLGVYYSNTTVGAKIWKMHRVKVWVWPQCCLWISYKVYCAHYGALWPKCDIENLWNMAKNGPKTELLKNF